MSYKNVVEMCEGIGLSKKTVDSLRREIDSRKLSTILFALRCKADVTQKAMAERMGCGPKTIRRIENSKNEQLNFGDLLRYAYALGLRIDMSISDLGLEECVMFNPELLSGWRKTKPTIEETKSSQKTEPDMVDVKEKMES